MKAAYLSVLALCLPLVLAAQGGKTNNGPIISVQDTVNLGEIFLDDLSDEHGKVSVKVTNTGNSPLILRNVTGCCGTNVKSWPRGPILPGKDALILVEFRTEPRPQRIGRTITVESNAANGKSVKVAIAGVVIARESPNEISL